LGVLPGPLALPELELRDLARRGRWQLVQEGDSFGRLVAGNRGLDVVDDLLLAGLEHDEGLGPLPHFSSGTPVTAASSTAWWVRSACSISTVEMFSPPEITTSLARSKSCM